MKLTKKEFELIKRYDGFNILGTALFMNDGYCYLDDDNMPTNGPLNLSSKWKPWTYQVNLYNVLLETAGIDINNKNIELLDVACGQGGGASFYKDYYKFKSVFGVDLNPNYIKHASERDSNVNFLNASATNIPLADNKFDIITCLEAEIYFEPLEKYCQQAVRLLKKDGFLIHSSSDLSINKSIFERYFEIIKIRDIGNNVGVGCAISKHMFWNNKTLREIYINDEYRSLLTGKTYEVYVMKKKQKKARKVKTQKEFDKISFESAKAFPKKLNRENYFQCPIWFADEPSFVKDLNKASDKYIKQAKKNLKKDIDKRNKKFGDKGDMGHVFHSSTLIDDPNFLELQNYVGATSHNLLNEMGFDLTQYQVFTTEMWVQEFAKDGGGHHTLHTHWNGHISGFYFLKGSEKTSKPMFEDPRPGNMMNLLPQKYPTKITYASHQISYEANPGKMIFFPSYMPHQYVVDMGYEPFRFIHFNCQAIPKGALNVFQKK